MLELKQDRYLVSIIIPIYNGANYMREAIDSALNQTYKNIEVLVINDGSTDNGETDRIARNYGDKIRYFYKNNGGVSSALNYGISQMKGDYFSWLSHDDVYTLTKIEDQVKALAKIGDDNLLCYCKDIHIDKNSNTINTPIKINRLEVDKVSIWNTVLEDMLKYGIYNGCAFLIPRKVFFEDGLRFDENLRFSQDALMWYQIFLKKYNLLCIHNIDVKGRVHSQQVTQTSQSVFKKDSEYICDKVLNAFIENSTKEVNIIYYYIRFHAIHGNRNVVLKSLSKAKANKKLSFFQMFSIQVYRIYGKLRPFIRRAYYKLCKKI